MLVDIIEDILFELKYILCLLLDFVTERIIMNLGVIIVFLVALNFYMFISVFGQQVKKADASEDTKIANELELPTVWSAYDRNIKINLKGCSVSGQINKTLAANLLVVNLNELSCIANIENKEP